MGQRLQVAQRFKKKNTKTGRYKILREKTGKWHLINIEYWLKGAAEINPSLPTDVCLARKDS